MEKIFAKRGITKDAIVPYDAFHPFGTEAFDIRGALDPYRAQFLTHAEKLLDKPYPQLEASVYMQFVRNGNRSVYESFYFERRSMLTIFVMAELIEGKGRFTDRIIDGMWHIMEESTWILPAHNWSGKPVTGSVVSLPDTFSSEEDGDDMKHIDLFSAGTGGQMACLWYLTKSLLNAENPIIRKRLHTQLKQRILHPFYTYQHDWWMGADETRVLNNWTPWIISNVLTVIAFCEEDTQLRRDGVEKALVILDRYIAHFPEDGGCDEGPGYWNVAGGSFFDCLELLYHMSDGKIDVFDEPIVRRMCEYIMNVSVSGDCYLNFADAPSHVHPDFRMIARMGRRLSSPALSAFASTIVYQPDICPLSNAESYRFFLNLTEAIPATIPYQPEYTTFYENLQIAITREKDGMFLAIKGGTNNESHNHNDVGQFVLFDRGAPIIIDAGVEQYCRDTFSDKRYTLWAMRAKYHNIPEINGIEQQPGGQYHAEVVSYDKPDGKLTLELKNAYPDAAGILSYQRAAQLQNHTVCVTDILHLSAPGTVAFHYLTVDEPIIDDGIIRFRSGHCARFDASLEASVEAIALNNGKIAREWQREALYRITLYTKTPIQDAVYTLTFLRA